MPRAPVYSLNVVQWKVLKTGSRFDEPVSCLFVRYTLRMRHIRLEYEWCRMCSCRRWMLCCSWRWGESCCPSWNENILPGGLCWWCYRMLQHGSVMQASLPGTQHPTLEDRLVVGCLEKWKWFPASAFLRNSSLEVSMVRFQLLVLTLLNLAKAVIALPLGKHTW